MDEVLPRLLEFSAALRRFRESIEVSMREMRHTHDAVDPLWQDHSRKEYDSVYQPMEERLKRFVHDQSPVLCEFIDTKARQLDQYLHGRRGSL
jgi:uncharacterized protein YukE